VSPVGRVCRRLLDERARQLVQGAIIELRGNPLTLLGAIIVTTLTVVTIVGPVLTPYDPAAQALQNRLQPPSMAHPLGTDQFGRDMLTRLIYGAQFSMGIALAVTTIRVVVGTGVGLVAGYAGGWVDEVLMRIVDIQLAFPGLILALVVAGILGPSLQNLMIALAVVGWATYARVVRGSVLSVKERDYVAAARLNETPRHRLFRRHLLPNIINPVIVIATLNIGTVVLATAGLSFIGLGAQPPTPEWGTMLAGGREYIRQAWWIVNAPGIAIALTVLGFNLLGDGLRDLLDPRQQTRIEEV